MSEDELLPRSRLSKLTDSKMPLWDQLQRLENYASRHKEPSIRLYHHEGGLQAEVRRGPVLLTVFTWNQETFEEGLKPKTGEFLRNEAGLARLMKAFRYLTSYDFRAVKAYKYGGRMIFGQCRDTLKLQDLEEGLETHHVLIECNKTNELHWVFHDGIFPHDAHSGVFAEVGDYMEKHVMTAREVYHRLNRTDSLKEQAF